jgi:pimeloyl-ACP methyl ester carboxylesterase
MDVIEESKELLNDFKRHLSYLFKGRERKIWKKENYDKNAVVLLHGYLQGDAALAGLEDFLYKNGINVDNRPYAFWRDLREIEGRIIKRVKDIYALTNKKVDIVGHSEGGLVALNVARKIPDLVERVLAICSPHNGTWTALLGIFSKSGRQMLPYSSYIRRSDGIPKGVKVYSIEGKKDIVMIPRKSPVLKGAKNIILDAGHVAPIGEKYYNLILNILNDDYLK